MSDATPGAPGWHADPSGRHQYRWWDGTAFTDQVADDGLVTTDAGPLGPEPPPQPPAPGPPAAQPFPEPAPTKRGRFRIVAVAVAVVAIVAAGVALFLLLGGDDGTSGTGTFEGTIDNDTPIGVHEVALKAGDALTVEVEPDNDLDAVLGFAVAEEDADRIEETYEDLGGVDIRDIEDAFDTVDADDLEVLGEDIALIGRIDVGFAGDEERLLLAVPFDVDVQVVVAPFIEGDEGEGDYDITIESFDLDVEDDADGEALLEAVRDNDEIPDAFREMADELLTEAE